MELSSSANGKMENKKDRARSSMPTGPSLQEPGVSARSKEKGRCCTIMETFTREDSQKASKRAKEFISIEIKVPSLKVNGKKMSKKAPLKSATKTEKCKLNS